MSNQPVVPVPAPAQAYDDSVIHSPWIDGMSGRGSSLMLFTTLVTVPKPIMRTWMLATALILRIDRPLLAVTSATLVTASVTCSEIPVGAWGDTFLEDCPLPIVMVASGLPPPHSAH